MTGSCFIDTDWNKSCNFRRERLGILVVVLIMRLETLIVDIGSGYTKHTDTIPLAIKFVCFDL